MKQDAFRKQRARRTFGESFTISRSRTNLPLRLRLWNASRTWREVRSTRSRPLLESLKQWFEETLGKLSRKSDPAMAVRDALGRWGALLRFWDDGRIEIDNNSAERALRVVALGRKNFLFCGLRWWWRK